MPTYQYACTECGHRFEQVQAFTDPSLTACPECAGKLRKVYGSVGVVFKGSGFYRNDARAGEGAKRDGGDAPANGSGADKGSEKAGDTAAAAKADPAAKPAATTGPAKVGAAPSGSTSAPSTSAGSSGSAASSGSSGSAAPKKAAAG